MTNTPCVSDGALYNLSNKADFSQLRCLFCKQFWYEKDHVPTCKTVEINTVFMTNQPEQNEEKCECDLNREMTEGEKELARGLDEAFADDDVSTPTEQKCEWCGGNWIGKSCTQCGADIPKSDSSTLDNSENKTFSSIRKTWRDYRGSLGCDFSHKELDIEYVSFIAMLLSKRDAEIREIVESLKTRFRCGACDSQISNHNHTLTCVFISELLIKLDNQ